MAIIEQNPACKENFNTQLQITFKDDKVQQALIRGKEMDVNFGNKPDFS